MPVRQPPRWNLEQRRLPWISIRRLGAFSLVISSIPSDRSDGRDHPP
ncbi:hypothetical protein A2U01_0022898, partial [Trifolium medium]|nr:hypothetical protein [Trifolium medium]